MRTEKELGLESENWRKSFLEAGLGWEHTIEQYEGRQGDICEEGQHPPSNI